MSAEATPHWDTAPPRTVGRCEIRKRVMGFAYPKNGNLHNPTPRVRWFVFCEGRPVGSAAHLREAEALAGDFNADPEW